MTKINKIRMILKSSFKLFTVMAKCFGAAALLGIVSIKVADAQVRLPSLIGSNMVLQQKSQTTLWGWATPAENITITNSWNKDTVKSVADGLAHWRQAKLKTPFSRGPYTITIKASNTYSYRILFS